MKNQEHNSVFSDCKDTNIIPSGKKIFCQFHKNMYFCNQVE